MITSCSPGWVNYAEYNYGDLLPHLSSCKSPHEMFGAILKSYYCEKNGIDPKDMFVVSIMPCTAKKSEKVRPELSVNGLPDVDAVLTTRELGKLIKRSGINFTKLPDAEFDNDIVGDYTGAGVIFGTTGGVMEAALRTAAYKLTGEELPSAELKEIRGFNGIKEAAYTLGGTEVKVAVASGIANANYVMDQIKSGTAPWHFVEIMCCPGGCVNGGGQPIQPASVRNFTDLKALRAKALYDQDEAMTLRKSHKSPVVNKLYEEFFDDGIGGHKAHHCLHTTYVARKKFQ
jgi:NADP-reducing hydrogenase subunit HndD